MENQTEPRSIRPWLIIVLAVVILAALGFFSWNYYKNKKKIVAPVATIPTTTTAETLIATNGSSANSSTKVNSSTSQVAAVDPSTPVTSTQSSDLIPAIQSISTDDTDFNGKIDTITVAFKSSSLMDLNTVSAAGFTVDDYSIAKDNETWSIPMYSYPDNRAGSEKFNISLKEKSNFDTNVTPTVSYKASDGFIKSKIGGKLASFSQKAVDGAYPAVVSATAVDTNNQSGIQNGDKVVITTSEPLKIVDANSLKKMDNFEFENADGKSINHSWFSGNGSIGTITLSGDSKTLTVTLSDAGGAPTIAVGDYLFVSNGDIVDSANNILMGSKIKIAGSF